jgi:WS/DGAT/MGAT family acyltransferase
MAYDRLSPLDASFLHVEDSVTHMHIGSVSIFEGPPPPYADLRDMIAGKLPLVRRYRQLVKRVPFDLGRPVWVDDPYFDIEYHLRHSALPKPGGDPELRRLVGRVMAQQLDRNRPLWEMWMVEGLADERWAVVSKVHHCMVDGVSGSDLLGLILDKSPEPPWDPPTPWIPELYPAGWELAAEAILGLLSSPFELSRMIRARTRVPRRILSQTLDLATGLWHTTGALRAPSAGVGTTLNGPIGPHRRWVATSVPVADIKAVRHRLGGTFNDVVLAVITKGFRDLLQKRDESVENPIHTMVPVSVRARDDRGRAIGDGSLANRVSAMFADLPVNIDDPLERLRAISEQMAGVKDSKQAVAAEALTDLTGFAPPMLLSLAGRLGTKLSQHSVNTVTTNVPGPQVPLYAVGRTMVRSYPYVPLGLQLRITVAIFSYDGDVTFGITGDYDGAPDIEILAEGINLGMVELLAAEQTATIIGMRAPAPVEQTPADT